MTSFGRRATHGSLEDPWSRRHEEMSRRNGTFSISSTDTLYFDVFAAISVTSHTPLNGGE